MANGNQRLVNKKENLAKDSKHKICKTKLKDLAILVILVYGSALIKIGNIHYLQTNVLYGFLKEPPMSITILSFVFVLFTLDCTTLH